MLTDEHYMRRALQIAQYGKGFVSPNPLVGCVIVKDDTIIGEGWHKKFGGPHAEVNAVNSVQDQSMLKDSIIYVSLEPCSHYGKTPPCADLLVRVGAKRVVICNEDPNPQVAGKGIARLREAGIKVVTGVLEEEGLHLNRRFFHFMTQNRPYFILKWAQTCDGFIARENYDSKWISSEMSRQYVHKWRSEEDAIMIGRNTAMYDNPNLNVRGWDDNHPKRIVIDRNLSLPNTLNLFDQRIPTIVFNNLKDKQMKNLEYIKLSKKNFLEQLVMELFALNIQSVFVEGGSQLINAFLQSGLWNEARVFVSPTHFCKGISAPVLDEHEPDEEQTIDTDQLFTYYNTQKTSMHF